MGENGDTHPLEAPTLASAHAALERLYGPHTEDIWRTLLFSAGLTGEETGDAAFVRIVVTMQAADPITRLCGRALAVRAAAFARLSRSGGVTSDAGGRPVEAPGGTR
ncbi:hypothetical protein ACQP2F_07720 [Actinoplanes sp. CA-030573]|uniref:hypothetical protein n=1 Tax=Actinoplanes sp. CA-030573 TaxID=3239898 RepID=UPI003D8A3511